MLNFNSNTALEGYKQGIKTDVAAQKSMGKNVIDTSGTDISIFGYKVRQDINYNAERCNSQSGILGTLQPKQDYGSIENIFAGVDKTIQALQGKVEWAQKAGQDILKIPGLSDQAKSETLQTMNRTVQFGQQTIANTVNSINDAISNLKSATNNSTPETVTRAVQNTQKTIETTSKNGLADDKVFDNQDQINEPATKDTTADNKNTTTKDIPAKTTKKLDTKTKTKDIPAKVTKKLNTKINTKDIPKITKKLNTKLNTK